MSRVCADFQLPFCFVFFAISQNPNSIDSLESIETFELFQHCNRDIYNFDRMITRALATYH